jgi:phosphoribosyl-AMP cyclohydrolase
LPSILEQERPFRRERSNRRAQTWKERLEYPYVTAKVDQVPDFSKGDGLLPAIAQDAASGEVLMLAWMNAESFSETLKTRQAVYFSRSRGRLWRKGEESGHTQIVRSILVDCDADTILLKVEQQGGAACHTGYRSCFYRELTPDETRIVGVKVFEPTDVYGKNASKEAT